MRCGWSRARRAGTPAEWIANREIKKREIAAASISFLKCSPGHISSEVMDDKLTPASQQDVEICLSLALTSGRALVRTQAAETMAKVVAERLVAELERSGFVIMRKPIPSDTRDRSGPGATEDGLRGALLFGEL